jgi:hypothetical protein
MLDKQLKEVSKTTPDNWVVLQYLFFGQEQLTGEHPNLKHSQLDNWDVLQSLFAIAKTSTENSPVVLETEPNPPTNDIETIQRTVEAAKTQAEVAKAGAEAAQRAAEAAQQAIEAIKAEAETARNSTEMAQQAAVAAKNQAEAAKTGAETAQRAAEIARTEAEAAKTQAETARTGAEAAKTQAETARTEAETARTEAEAAKTALEKADLFPSRMKMAELVVFFKKHGVKLLVAAIAFMLLAIFLGRTVRRQKPVSPSNSMIYIDPVHGSDRNNGTNKAPFKTLSHALKLTNPGDTVHFLPGSYNTNIREDEPLVIPASVVIVVHSRNSGSVFSDIRMLTPREEERCSPNTALSQP